MGVCGKPKKPIVPKSPEIGWSWLEVMLGHDDGMFSSYAEQIWKYSTKLGVLHQPTESGLILINRYEWYPWEYTNSKGL